MGLADRLRDVPLRRICSSPTLRCRQTLERVSADHAIAIDVDDRLEPKGDPELDVAAALELLETPGGGPILICASRATILELLAALGVGRHDSRALRCQKGGLWMLERRDGRVVRAEYAPPRESSAGKRMAVLDIGSTSLSLLIADVGPMPGHIQPVHRQRAELRLGASADQIGAADCDRIVKLCRSMQAEAERRGSAGLIPVATASLRDAANGPFVADLIDEVLASPLRVLSGEEEARIVYEAVRVRLGFDDQPTAVLDLGGGSLDLALGRGSIIEYTATEPLGVTRLHAEHVRDDPMTGAQAGAIRQRVADRFGPHAERIAGPRLLRCAAAGGSVRALARLVLVGRGTRKGETTRIRGLRILRSELESLADRLRRASHDERAAMPGIKLQRADLLPTAALVLAEVLARLDLPELLVSDWGLRQGVLLAETAQRPCRPPDRG